MNPSSYNIALEGFTYFEIADTTEKPLIEAGVQEKTITRTPTPKSPQLQHHSAACPLRWGSTTASATEAGLVVPGGSAGLVAAAAESSLAGAAGAVSLTSSLAGATEATLATGGPVSALGALGAALQRPGGLLEGGGNDLRGQVQVLTKVLDTLVSQEPEDDATDLEHKAALPYPSIWTSANSSLSSCQLPSVLTSSSTSRSTSR